MGLGLPVAFCPRGRAGSRGTRGFCNLRHVARDALHMRKAWVTAEPPAAVVPASVRVRALSEADESALGRLMWLAFRGGVDDEYSAPGDADADAAGALAGRWGPVVWQASLTAELNSAVISAVVIVLDDAHQDLPLLAFAVTDPASQRRRIGRRLIEESIQRLDAIGGKELNLARTRGNPAFTLYQQLGFEVVPGGQAPEAPDVPGQSL